MWREHHRKLEEGARTPKTVFRSGLLGLQMREWAESGTPRKPATPFFGKNKGNLLREVLLARSSSGELQHGNTWGSYL